MTRLDRDQWQVEHGVAGGFRQSDYRTAQVHYQRKPGLRNMGQADNAKAAHFQHSRQGRGGAGMAIENVHLIVGN